MSRTTVCRLLFLFVASSLVLVHATPAADQAAPRPPSDDARAAAMLRDFHAIVNEGGPSHPDYARALYSIGHAHFNGFGVKRDSTAAAAWYLRAAEAGDVTAQGVMGVLYAMGKGVRASIVNAVRWWRSAADAGDVESTLALGRAFAEGTDGLPQDEAEAARWWSLAASRGSAEGAFNVGVAALNGVGIAVCDTALAASWWRQAADEGGFARASYVLALALADGSIPQVGADAEAERRLRGAAEAGVPDAAEALKQFLEVRGRGAAGGQRGSGGGAGQRAKGAGKGPPRQKKAVASKETDEGK